MIYKSLRPRCFGRWLPTYYVWGFAIQMIWMALAIFKSWMMSLNVHFKSRMSSYLWTIMLPIPSSMLVGVNHLVFRPCRWVVLLSFSYHLMLQAWCSTWVKEWLFHSKLGIRISFWNAFPLSLIPNFTRTWVREIVPNVRHAIMWCSQVQREMKL